MKNRKIVTLSLCLLLMIGVSSAAFAEIIMQPFASSLIKSATATTSGSGNTVTATCKITGVSVVAQLGVSSFYIEEKNGSTWSAVEKISANYGYDKLTHSVTLKFTGTKGKQYRCVANFYIKNGSSSETKTVTSSAITL